LLVQALQLGDKSGDSTPGQQDDNTPSARSSTCFFKFCSRSANHNITASPNLSTPTTPVESQDPGSPAAFLITNDQDLANTNGEAIAGDEMDGPSAADYDPTVDMREDRQRNDLRHNDEVSSGAYDETLPTTEQDVLLPTETAEVEEKPKKSKDDFDMFAEDDDDMFAEDPVPNGKPHAAISDDVAKAVPIPQAKELDIGLLDNWDDIEGYYKVILGELINGRYHVQANLGKGMFSGVVRAMDVTTKKLVAIKLIRNNETM
jgi:serine/threonine-protein kinase PRP4